MQCPRLARPSFEVLAMSCFSFILLFVAVAMVVMTVRNACRGVGTIEVERMRRWRHLYKKSGDAALQRWDPRIRLYVPGEDGREGGVILVDPHVKLFDLGVSRNWQTLMGDHWWQWLLPWPTRCVSRVLSRRALLSRMQPGGGRMDTTHQRRGAANAQSQVRIGRFA